MQNKKPQHKRLPLRNVAMLYALTRRLMERGAGQENIGLYYGPTGVGKTEATVATRNMTNGILLSATDTWTRKHLLKNILHELSVHDAKGSVATLEDLCAEHLADTPERPVIVDEADKLTSCGVIETLRAIGDKAKCPIVLVGEEKLPRLIAEIPRVDGRVLIRQVAVSCNLEDARRIVDYFAPGIEIDDICLESIRLTNMRRPRRIVTACATIVEYCRNNGLTSLDADSYRSMHRDTAAPKFLEDA